MSVASPTAPDATFEPGTHYTRRIIITTQMATETCSETKAQTYWVQSDIPNGDLQLTNNDIIVKPPRTTLTRVNLSDDLYIRAELQGSMVLLWAKTGEVYTLRLHQGPKPSPILLYPKVRTVSSWFPGFLLTFETGKRIYLPTNLAPNVNTIHLAATKWKLPKVDVREFKDSQIFNHGHANVALSRKGLLFVQIHTPPRISFTRLWWNLTEGMPLDPLQQMVYHIKLRSFLFLTESGQVYLLQANELAQITPVLLPAHVVLISTCRDCFLVICEGGYVRTLTPKTLRALVSYKLSTGKRLPPTSNGTTVVTWRTLPVFGSYSKDLSLL